MEVILQQSFQLHLSVSISVCLIVSRLHQYAKLFLFSPSSGLYACPLAMTDGAAKVLEVCYLVHFARQLDKFLRFCLFRQSVILTLWRGHILA